MNGVITPNSSMTTDTLTPKQEDIDISFSDISGAVGTSFASRDGLPSQIPDQDEGYHTQAQDRKSRSDARKSVDTSLLCTKLIIS